MTPRKHPPRARMAHAAQRLHGHAQRLQERGAAAFLVHRRERGRRPHHVFDAVRPLLKGAGAARWYYSPWPRGAASHVLIVQVSPPWGAGGQPVAGA